MMGGPACGSRRSGRCWRCRSGSGCSCLGVGAVLSSSDLPFDYWEMFRRLDKTY